MGLRGPQPRKLRVPRGEYRRLKLVVRRRRVEHAVAQRARMILELRAGKGPTEVGRTVGVSERNVRKWRSRFENKPCLESLYEEDRSGRPLGFSVATRCELVQLACERPDGVTTPLREMWTQQALAEALCLRTGHRMSRSTVQRVLSAEGLRPHRVRYWLTSPDREFRPKVKRICELYLKPPKNSVVVCIDEKPMQALERKHSTRTAPDGSARYEYEYIRHGTAVLVGAFDIQTGQLFGKVLPDRSADRTVAFMEELAGHYEGQTVYVVWDNLNTHYDGPDRRWTEFNQRHGGRFHFVYTPIHASWMNQVEVWFSILQRRVLRRGSFDSARRLTIEVEAFIRYWNLFLAHPFRWTFTGDFVKTDRKRAA